MSYINYNIESNSISIVKANNKFKECFEEINVDKNYNLIKKDEKFIGIKLLNFLSNIELQGRVAEEHFKNLLNQNQVPYLYIGQGPEGIEYSEVLKKTLKSKRPDFLVNIPDVGALFVDVKSNSKLGLLGDDNQYFQLFITEIESLIKLYEQLLIPVWIAFYDKESIENDLIKFYFVPISTLKKYLDSIKNRLTTREWDLLSTIRIADELLYEITSKSLIFKAGISIIDDNLLEIFSNKHKGIIRKIEDEIKHVIRTRAILKTQVANEIISIVGDDLFFKIEVDIVLKKLIDEGIILYKAKKTLSLLGE